MEWVRPCRFTVECLAFVGAAVLTKASKATMGRFKRAKPEFFHEPSQQLKNLSLAVVTGCLSQDLLRPFKGLAAETRRKLRFAGIVLDCVPRLGTAVSVCLSKSRQSEAWRVVSFPEFVGHCGSRHRGLKSIPEEG